MNASAGGEICGLNSMVWRLPLGGVIVYLFNATQRFAYFQQNGTKHPIIPAAQDLFGLAGRETSILFMRL